MKLNQDTTGHLIFTGWLIFTNFVIFFYLDTLQIGSESFRRYFGEYIFFAFLCFNIVCILSYAVLLLYGHMKDKQRKEEIEKSRKREELQHIEKERVEKIKHEEWVRGEPERRKKAEEERKKWEEEQRILQIKQENEIKAEELRILKSKRKKEEQEARLAQLKISEEEKKQEELALLKIQRIKEEQEAEKIRVERLEKEKIKKEREVEEQNRRKAEEIRLQEEKAKKQRELDEALRIQKERELEDIRKEEEERKKLEEQKIFQQQEEEKNRKDFRKVFNAELQEVQRQWKLYMDTLGVRMNEFVHHAQPTLTEFDRGVLMRKMYEEYTTIRSMLREQEAQMIQEMILPQKFLKEKIDIYLGLSEWHEVFLDEILHINSLGITNLSERFERKKEAEIDYNYHRKVHCQDFYEFPPVIVYDELQGQDQNFVVNRDMEYMD